MFLESLRSIICCWGNLPSAYEFIFGFNSEIFIDIEPYIFLNKYHLMNLMDHVSKLLQKDAKSEKITRWYKV